MTNFTDLYADAWRDYETDGVPASGAYKPRKVTIRALGQALDMALEDIRQILALGGVTVYKTTRVSLYADLAYAAGTIAAVTQDGTSSYNGIYVKAGASGSGSWSQIFQFLDSAAVLASLTAYVDGEIDGISARVDAVEGDVADLMANTVDGYTARRAADALSVFGGDFRNHTADAIANAAIDTTGAQVAAGGRYATDYIELTSTMAITRMGASVIAGSRVPIAFYDASKAFLGHLWAPTDVTVYDIADAPAGTKYARLTAETGAVQYYVYDQKSVDLVSDLMFTIYGTPTDSAGGLSSQYVIKSTGAIGNSASYLMTDALPVSADSYVSCGGGLISNVDSLRCQIAFYGAAEAYLGSHNPVARNQTIRVGDLFPTAETIRITFHADDVGPVRIVNSGAGLAFAMDMLANGAIVNYLAPSLVSAERLNLVGGTVQAGHPYFRTTDYIPVTEGQVFYVSAQNVTGLGAVVAGYDSSKVFVANLLIGPTNSDFVSRRVTIPSGVAYIRATARNDMVPYALLSVRPAQVLQESGAPDIVYLAPKVAFGRIGEPLYMHARGIIGDRAVPLAWAPSSGSFDVFRGVETLQIRKDSDAPSAVAVRATVGSVQVDIGEILLEIVDTGSVTSPAAPLNIVAIGDSTMSQLSSGDPEAIDGDGTMINEVSRQLTGIGVPALSTGPSEWGPVVAGDIRPALGLGNIHFRGTRGTATVKHEGRGGWKPLSYLERTDAVGGDGKSNAFWDPALTPWGPEGTAWKFSMKYFIENNGWDVGTVISGVESDGGNLLVMIALGWNDWAAGVDPTASAGYVAAMMDRIHVEYPAATVWVVGLWAPPEGIFKGNTSSVVQRWYCAADVFRTAVRDYGLAYRKVCDDRDYAEFIQVSHQMDPDYCFSRASMAPNRVTTDASLAIEGAGDIVHMRRRGYAMWADAITDAILWRFCRP
ncbi:SGNH/GDSL hydrolase family protein [Zavarzinia aquatilis]|uniref:Uncharacterized protein n=1 Tax=Zavarzinia aquatilis TaxID=2211142 RepID=A0A317EC03_9PROT|nr:SGNH/GDSL hydrolase family protein [Zavarzinia aquatilis]PWR24587.1 hypothetical protein DKG74_07215 [Zavarzinia aquatilis]